MLGIGLKREQLARTLLDLGAERPYDVAIVPLHWEQARQEIVKYKCGAHRCVVEY